MPILEHQRKSIAQRSQPVPVARRRDCAHHIVDLDELIVGRRWIEVMDPVIVNVDPEEKSAIGIPHRALAKTRARREHVLHKTFAHGSKYASGTCAATSSGQGGARARDCGFPKAA